MKSIQIKSIISIMFLGIISTNAQVGINTNMPDASAALDITSTTQGMLVPRMTSAQRTTINSPANGLLVYQTDGTAGFYFYNGTSWTSINKENNDASALTTGTLPDARLSSNVTTQGNAFNGTNQLVQTNASGQLPAMSGENLTNLNASNLASGTVPTSVLGSGTANNTTFLRGDNTWGSLSGDNLGNHTATQNIDLSNNDIIGVDSIGTAKAKIGGNNYPTTTGTNGQVLTTDGVGQLSWGTASGTTGVVFQASVSGTQSLPAAVSTTNPGVVNFDNVITPLASGIISTTTVTSGTGSGTATYSAYKIEQAGNYMIICNLASSGTNNAGPCPVLEINTNTTSNPTGAGSNSNRIYGTATVNVIYFQTHGKARGQLSTVYNFNAGDTFLIRGQNTLNGSVILNADLSSRLIVIKL